jgi:restriction system protein
MGRKDESLLNLLTRLPWQVSVLVAAGAYVFFRFVLPAIPVGNPLIKSVLQGVSMVAPLIVLALLAAGFVSVVLSKQKQRLLNKQTGLKSVGELSWQQFESLVGEVFRRKGYRVLENPGGGPDEGVDLRLRKDGKKAYVQCKHWKKKQVGVKPVRELYGVMKAKDADEGIVVTYGDFTREARAFARGKPLQLIEGEKLGKLIQEAQRRNRAGQARPAAPKGEKMICPKCGSDMVLREAKRGKYAGRKFWGCSRYPKCEGILPCRSDG